MNSLPPLRCPPGRATFKPFGVAGEAGSLTLESSTESEGLKEKLGSGGGLDLRLAWAGLVSSVGGESAANDAGRRPVDLE